MRNFLNLILAFIGSESLTDDEFDTVSDDLPEDYTVEVYDALKAILLARESVSAQPKKLKLYFLAHGVVFPSTNKAVPARSEIFVGAVLDD